MRHSKLVNIKLIAVLSTIRKCISNKQQLKAIKAGVSFGGNWVVFSSAIKM